MEIQQVWVLNPGLGRAPHSRGGVPVSQADKKSTAVAGIFLILTVSLLISGCAPLLVGAGAVGGYHVAKEH